MFFNRLKEPFDFLGIHSWVHLAVSKNIENLIQNFSLIRPIFPTFTTLCNEETEEPVEQTVTFGEFSHQPPITINPDFVPPSLTFCRDDISGKTHTCSFETIS